MNGCVIPGTPIAVDVWKIRDCKGAKLFFLTHIHGDHIVGLTSSWNRSIYCSETTAKLLISRYEIKEELVKILTENESHLLSVDDQHTQYVTVSVFNANHCPGAVMFLFEGDFGKILHTGDFRYCQSMIEDTKLKNHIRSVDVLYLDNTYCSPDCRFFSREEATGQILKIIETHPDHDVLFGMRNLGKEDLLVQIAIALNERIGVSGNFLEAVSLLALRDVFIVTDGCRPCRLRVVQFRSINHKQVAALNSLKPTIAILPTAIFTGLNSGGQVQAFSKESMIFVIPYSDHSSYSELIEFVSIIQPKRVVPIVNANARGPFGSNMSQRANMDCFDHLLCKPSPPSKRRRLDDTLLLKASDLISTKSLPSYRNIAPSMDNQQNFLHRRLTKRRSVAKRISKIATKGVVYENESENSSTELLRSESFEACDEDLMGCGNLLSSKRIDDIALNGQIIAGELCHDRETTTFDPEQHILSIPKRGLQEKFVDAVDPEHLLNVKVTKSCGILQNELVNIKAVICETSRIYESLIVSKTSGVANDIVSQDYSQNIDSKQYSGDQEDIIKDSDVCTLETIISPTHEDAVATCLNMELSVKNVAKISKSTKRKHFYLCLEQWLNNDSDSDLM